MMLLKLVIMVVQLILAVPIFLLGFVLGFVFAALMGGMRAAKDFDEWLTNEN